MEEKFLIFTVRDGKYALPSRLISEVASLDKVFPLPLIPPYVRGIINRYSVPYALIDLCFLLYKDTSIAKKLIILKKEVDKLAFLIDDMIDIADLSPDKIMKIGLDENTDSGGAVDNYAVSGFFEWGGSQIICLDANEIINRIKQEFEKSV